MNRIQIIPYIKDYVETIAIFCVDVRRIYMNNAYNDVNTYSMSVSPWKMLLRGLEFDLLILCATSHRLRVEVCLVLLGIWETQIFAADITFRLKIIAKFTFFLTFF